MKKLLYIFIFFITLLVGFSAFISSTYFFNKYIAKNIKEYGFNYVKVDGALFKGFDVQDLSYKGRELSSNVELQIDPFKLIKGLISIKKLHLISVRKDVLEDIVDDFKPKDNSSESSNKIDINFEFKDILLTIKPFIIDNIKIKKAALSIDKLRYVDSKFYIGELEYESKSDIANISFSGQFKKKILKIEHIDIKNLDTEKFLKVLKFLKYSNESNSSDSEILNSPFTPKIINVKEATLNIKPFKIKDLTLKDLKLKIKNGKFNIEKLLLEKAKLSFKYTSKELSVNLNSKYIDKNLTVNNILVNIKEPNKIEKLIKSLNIKSNNNNSKSNNVVPIENIYINKALLKVAKYRYKDELLKELAVDLNSTNFNKNSKLLSAKEFNIKLDSTLFKLACRGSIKRDIIFNNINIVSTNIDRVIKLISNSKSDSNETSQSFIKLPDNFIISKLNIKGKKASFGDFKIDTGAIVAKDIKGSLKKLYISRGNLKANVNSPWGEANLSGNIKENNYFAKGSYLANQNLLDRYSLPLIAKNIEKLDVDGRFGFKSLDINISLKGKDILKNLKDIDIISSKNRFKYNYINSNLLWSIDANINTPYSGSAKLINTLTYNREERLNYNGVLIPKDRVFKDLTLQKLFNKLSVNYKGDSKKLSANFISSELKGEFNTDYKNGNLTINNARNVKLSTFLKLPDNYTNAEVSNLKISSAINFKKPLPIKGDIALKSNLFNIDGKWSYSKLFSSDFTTTVPKNSIILKNIKKLNYSAIKSFKSKITVDSNSLKVELKNSNIFANLDYNLNNSSIKSNIKSSGINIDATGSLDNIDCRVSLNGIENSLNSIYKIYKLDSKIDNISGKLEANLKISNLEKISYVILSPQIVYKTKDSSTKIDNIYFKGNYYSNNLVIDSYKFNANEYKIFSNRSSLININKSIITIKQLWVNDSLNVVGNYNIDRQRGEFKLKSNRFELDSQKASVVLALNTTLNIIKDKKDISGTINIIDGKIKSAITRKNIADNEDIVILQRKKAKESTSFAKNIKLNIKIKGKKGLVYSQSGSYFKLIPDMVIKKSYNSLSNFKGVIKVAKNSYYTLNNKKLKVTKGLITFKGKSSSPNINIELKYSGKDYIVYVNISGTPTRPVLYFRSNPPLTKDQILAYLLFDDSSAIGTHSQEAMLNMIGGSLAKSLLGSIGIKIDHISVKENGFSIGKNITKNITVYYNQDGEKPSIKTRVDITKSIHTEIEVGKEKQSADIIFSREY